MPMDAVLLTALRCELESELTGAKIDRISMPERDLLILSARSLHSGNQRLLISLRPGSARIHLTEQSFENPAQPPMFCMLLRKHLLGARFTGFDQPEGERMLIITLDASDELNFHAEKKLCLELMGKSINLIVVDAEGRIIDCFRRQEPTDGTRRALLPGLFYALPPAQPKPSFFRTDAEGFARMVNNAPRSAEPDKWLLDTFGGLSPALCRELAFDGWDGLEENAVRLRAVAKSGGYRPVMQLKDGAPKDYSFMPMRQYSLSEQTEYPSFSAMLDDFYARRDRQENMRRRASEMTRTVNTALSRLRRKTAVRETELAATEKREEYRRRGDLITANLYRLSRGAESFEAVDYYSEDCPTVTISLDPRKTPQQNAAASYKLYNKAKTASRVLTDLIASAREEETYLESVLHELAQAENEADLTAIRAELTSTGYLKQKTGAKRPKKLPQREPLRFTAPSGTEVLVGRSNVQNDELTFRIAHRGDLWLHVQKLPGSHVIVSQRNGEADEDTLLFAAELAAAFSGAADGERVAVDCTLVRNVKKPAGAKPGRVSYTDYKTRIVRCDQSRYRSR